mmetsp:Transcript_40183/g.52909  ORF Transcript_40183/g.52909 Transcript_40183/m.52909 type:complete len:126 (+) Transcript_40183:106-483(+)
MEEEGGKVTYDETNPISECNFEEKKEERINELIQFNFEIFGKVQGVFFRKHTKRKADKLKIVGWVRNTRKGTVKGHAVGLSEEMNQFRAWLTSTGSPKSRIDKAIFSNVSSTEGSEHEKFEIGRS